MLRLLRALSIAVVFAACLFAQVAGAAASTGGHPAEYGQVQDLKERTEGAMRRFVATLILVGSVGSTAAAFQAQSGGSTADQACALLTRDLVMKVSTAAGRKLLDDSEPIAGTEDMSVAKGASACDYGPVLLVLDPIARPGEIRTQMRARGGPRDRSGAFIYRDHEPVSEVGDEAFFSFNSSWAFLHVWTGSRHFSVQMHAGLGDDGKDLKPNVIALAKAIVSQLR